LLKEDFTYSAGTKNTDLLEVGADYYFELATSSHGTVRSTKKKYALRSAAYALVYPNPVPTGGTLYVETSGAGAAVKIYNQSGICVKQLISTGELTAITLDVQAGSYIVKTDTAEIKIIVT
jgi:hypothetical protein